MSDPNEQKSFDATKSKYVIALQAWLKTQGDAEGIPLSRQKQYARFVDSFAAHYEATKPVKPPFDGVHFNSGKFVGEPIETIAKYNSSYCKFLLSKPYVAEDVKAVIRSHFTE